MRNRIPYLAAVLPFPVAFLVVSVSFPGDPLPLQSSQCQKFEDYVATRDTLWPFEVRGCENLDRDLWRDVRDDFVNYGNGDHACWSSSEYRNWFDDVLSRDKWTIQYSIAIRPGGGEELGFHIQDDDSDHQGIGIRKNMMEDLGRDTFIRVVVHEMLHHRYPNADSAYIHTQADFQSEYCYPPNEEDEDDENDNGEGENGGNGGGAGGGGGGGGNNNGSSSCRPDVVWIELWRSCEESEHPGAGGWECDDDGNCAIPLPGIAACLENYHIPVEVLVCS